jgi:hypothetical protein
MDKLANKMAYWGLTVGLKKGECVALMMENRVRPQHRFFSFLLLFG